MDDGVIVICDHGYSSTLAAASLMQIGYTSVADVEGGFEAWVRDGLPVVPAPSPADGHPGLGPAE